MTLDQLNKEYKNLEDTARCLELAINKFKGTENRENYLDYNVLYKARECVISEMDRFINRDWK